MNPPPDDEPGLVDLTGVNLEDLPALTGVAVERALRRIHAAAADPHTTTAGFQSAL